MSEEIASDATRLENALAKMNEAEAPADPADVNGDEAERAEVVKAEAAAEEGKEEEKKEEVVEEEEKEETSSIATQLAAISRRERHQKKLHAERMREVEDQKKGFDTKLEEMKKQLREELIREAASNPVDFFKSGGIEKLDEIAKPLYYSEMGDAAPADYREAQEMLALKRQIGEIKGELSKYKEEDERRAEQHAQESTRKEVISQYDSFLDENKGKYPHVERFAEAEASATFDDIIAVASEMYQSIGGVPDEEDVIEELESRLTKKMKRLGLTLKGETAEKVAKDEPKTLSNTQTTTTNAPKTALTEEERVARALAALEETWER